MTGYSTAHNYDYSELFCQGDDYYYQPLNVTRSKLSGIQAYRSALTLDWLAAEDQRQRELAAVFETEITPPGRTITTDCIGYARPASGKVARLMLELLKNLEGDESTVVTEMIQGLVRAKLLVETSMLEAEPDLDALVKTPGVMMGEPHTTFPRIIALTWMTVTDPVTTKKFGWCSLHKVNRYLAVTKPVDIAKRMKALEPIVARARYIMEEFIQHVTPLNIYDKTSPKNLLRRSEMSFQRTHQSLLPELPIEHPNTRVGSEAMAEAQAQADPTAPIEAVPVSNLMNGPLIRFDAKDSSIMSISASHHHNPLRLLPTFLLTYCVFAF